MDSVPFMPLEIGDSGRDYSQDREAYEKWRLKEGEKADQYRSDQSCHLDSSNRPPVIRNKELLTEQPVSELKLANRWMRFWASNLDYFFLLTII